MFDLERAIAGWRARMTAGGIKAPAVIDELESHLEDDVERQVQSGIGAEQAFHTAIRRLGQPGAVKEEFSKIGETNEAFARLKYFFLTLAGLQNPTLATDMNSSYSSSNFEPRWATYLKSTAFVLPAIALWTLLVLFVVPKLREICHQAGVTLPAAYGLVFLLMQHSVLICGSFVAALIFLEWRSDRWPRYRRATFGIAAFALNAAVLALISFLVVYAVVAAAQISQHAK